MRKYLELFKDGFDATLAEKTEVENWPYVGYSPSEGVVYTVIPKPADPSTYVTFTAEEDNSSIGLAKLSSYQTLEYSTDTITWNTFDTTTNISLNNGDKAYVRGVLSSDNSDEYYTQFKMTGKIAASGNCNAIWSYQDLNAPLKAYCGFLMFKDCTALTQAPELPTTTLIVGWESSAEFCYNGMFSGCTGLTQAPELPATTLALGCYRYMFSGCTGLTQAPELPATNLYNKNRCYQYMFYGCTGLTQAPELPATTLASGCYQSMFYGCTGLTQAPELPATTLKTDCYYSMFGGCKHLNYIKCLATDISARYCTVLWVDRVSSTGTFVKHPSMTSWTTGNSGIPEGWTVEDAVL